ncbi:MAG: vitamin B12 dependent methionine synthase [bacterium]|nr:vitamin B12 dependent methionine synthase [bacterium]
MIVIAEPFKLNRDKLKSRLRIPPDDTRFDNELTVLVEEAESIGKPKGLYKPFYIDAKGEDYIELDGKRFTSRVLRVNLEHAHRVFLYVATCGTELETWANKIADPLHQYWADAIKAEALTIAFDMMNSHLVQTFHPGKSATMSPGSLDDWPISEQRILFSLLGDTQETIGVTLTESMVMVPTKSISGIRFPTEVDFESCQLCPREICPGRRAPYDQKLYDRKYARTTVQLD